jgi:hypothetical protein
VPVSAQTWLWQCCQGRLLGRAAICNLEIAHPLRRNASGGMESPDPPDRFAKSKMENAEPLDRFTIFHLANIASGEVCRKSPSRPNFSLPARFCGLRLGFKSIPAI